MLRGKKRQKKSKQFTRGIIRVLIVASGPWDIAEAQTELLVDDVGPESSPVDAKSVYHIEERAKFGGTAPILSRCIIDQIKTEYLPMISSWRFKNFDPMFNIQVLVRRNARRGVARLLSHPMIGAVGTSNLRLNVENDIDPSQDQYGGGNDVVQLNNDRAHSGGVR